MGKYTEYLEMNLGFSGLAEERKKQLQRISQIRGGRDVLVYAANLSVGNAPIAIAYDDLLPINDQLANLNGNKLDLIIETPGGSGEVAEDMVRLLRGRYEEEMAVIVPGWAKSAGTILAMSGNEILMEPVSALGPIDAQLLWQGKTFSAHALLEGMDKIKKEVEKTGVLNKAHIPILQGISPGELQSAENALNFAKKLVTDWLANYKFKYWKVHSSNRQPVTEEDKKKRAMEIAEQLCDHNRWSTHGRSIKLQDLEGMMLKITDYSKEPDLADAIRRYYTLLQMTFNAGVYKIFETPVSQIYRMMRPQSAVPVLPAPGVATAADGAEIDVECAQCHTVSKVQANLGKRNPLKGGHIPFPANNKLKCPKCGLELDLTDIRRQLEAVSKKQIVTE